MTNVTLITSLYRTESHLRTYIEHASNVWHSVTAEGLSLEFVVVANDATPTERDLLEEFRASGTDVKVMYVERETLYASWNRGVRVASGEVVGFWNVDDVRTVEGIIRGVEAIRRGGKLVYFAHEVVRTTGAQQYRRIYEAIPYSAEAHRLVFKGGPFFMFSRPLYDQMGGFDERFRITGDFEWCVRVTYQHDLCPVPVVAGTFYLHGGNLSDTGDPRQDAEINMVHLLHGHHAYVKPVDPEIMRATWEKWGDTGCPIDNTMKDYLWGEGAEARYEQWQIEQKLLSIRRRRAERIRYIPKQIIDRLNLRPLLARLGVVKARKTLQETE